MRLFLQVEIGDWQESDYDKPFVHYASSLSNDIVGTDLDSQSEAVVVDLVLKLIDQSDMVFLLVIAHNPALSPGCAARVLNYLLKRPEHAAVVVLCGDHKTMEELVRGYEERIHKESQPEKIKTLIKEFAQ
jgi:hypothetical protein